MKFLNIIVLLTCIMSSCTQDNSSWVAYEDLDTKSVSITKSGISQIGNYTFKVVWDEELCFSDNIGHYGGIKKLEIFINDLLVNTFNHIEDEVALGYVNIDFFDYNLDGNVDFRLPLGCGASCYYKYYIFNTSTNKFEHSPSWDYLRIFKLNIKGKKIIPIPDGNYDTEKKLYQINGMKLEKKN